MKNERVKKKSLEKSKNVLEEKSKIVTRKICIKKTFTIIAMIFVQEQLKNCGKKFIFQVIFRKIQVKVQPVSTELFR